MVSSEHIIREIPTDPDNPYPLGRKVNHDPQSIAYPYRPLAAAPVVDRDRWPTTMPILSQTLGSCVPHTGVETLGIDNMQRPALSTADWVKPGGSEAVDLTDMAAIEQWIEDPDSGLYHLVTERDPFPGAFPPDDTGSDGTSMGNLFVSLGLLESFNHAFNGLSDVLQGLNEGPVWMGSDWYDSMFYPDSDGILHITPGSYVAGGHQFTLTGRIDVTRRLAEMRNHWLPSWGVLGYAWMPWDMVSQLLDQQGDAQVLRWSLPFPGTPETPERSGCLGQFLSGITRLHSGVDAPTTHRRSTR